MSKTILEVRNLSKSYPGVKALSGVSFSIKEGEVHAIVGENGAGKSTLIKSLTGAVEPDGGDIIYEGKSYKRMDSLQALDLGITAIYQEFNLIQHLSVAENIFFGREIMKGFLVNFKEMNARTSELCREMDIEMNPASLIKNIGVAYQQLVEIMKAVSRNAKVLIMDEPTAPLTNRETRSLFNMMRRLKEKNTTIIYISHRMEEIFEMCDRVTVMRDGTYITTKNIADTDRADLIKLMVGRDLGEEFPSKESREDADIVLELRNVATDKVRDISFTLKKGEILGLGGLVGAGRTEVARAIFGADKLHAGKIRINDRDVNIRSESDAIRNGIALIPEDRKRQGVILDLCIRENITFGSLGKITTAGFIQNRKEKEISSRYKKNLSIKTPSINQLVKNLSGGNQQKVVLAKWLATGCDILIFDEPTRGIDVGAKREIYNLMVKLTEMGKSIIMISSEMPELLGMSDRVLVMYNGRIQAELGKEEFCQERVLEHASGL